MFERCSVNCFLLLLLLILILSLLLTSPLLFLIVVPSFIQNETQKGQNIFIEIKDDFTDHIYIC